MKELISALLSRRALNSDNVITASYTVIDNLGRTLKKVGNFSIISFEQTDSTVNFTVQHVVEKQKLKISDTNIIAIDGMDLCRYADVYDINSDGSNKRTGKKRGRKPKSL